MAGDPGDGAILMGDDNDLLAVVGVVAPAHWESLAVGAYHHARVAAVELVHGAFAVTPGDGIP